MELTLLIVTAVSLVIALVMSYTAWRLGREERQRTEARVAALSAAAELGVADKPLDRMSPRIELAKAPWAPAPFTVEARTPVAPGPAAVPFDDRLDLHAVGSRPILGSNEEPQASAGRQRGLAAAAAALLVMLAGGLAWTMVDRAPSTASAAAATAPLELVSLRHERQSSKLAVSGLVRNPASGHPVDHLSAVVLLFDQQGTFVTSAKALVDFVRLGSGDESPFVVTLEAPATIARYRVSFRTDQGTVPHVDRRDASPIAQGEQAASFKVK
jgi:hypothetical protein